jgi:hypothetical protein
VPYVSVIRGFGSHANQAPGYGPRSLNSYQPVVFNSGHSMARDAIYLKAK